MATSARGATSVAGTAPPTSRLACADGGPAGQWPSISCPAARLPAHGRGPAYGHAGRHAARSAVRAVRAVDGLRSARGDRGLRRLRAGHAVRAGRPGRPQRPYRLAPAVSPNLTSPRLRPDHPGAGTGAGTELHVLAVCGPAASAGPGPDGPGRSDLCVPRIPSTALNSRFARPAPGP